MAYVSTRAFYCFGLDDRKLNIELTYSHETKNLYPTSDRYLVISKGVSHFWAMFIRISMGVKILRMDVVHHIGPTCWVRVKRS